MCTFGEHERAYLRVPVFITLPKFHEKTPREGRKSENGGEREKKSEILGGPAEGGLAEGGLGESRGGRSG